MMRTRRIILTFAAALLATYSWAQVTQDGFLLKDTHFSYRYNPALGDFKDFVSVGGASEHLVTNIGMGAFLYPRDGEVVTALHSSISAEEFLGKLKNENYVFGDANYNLFSYGFNRGKAFHTIEANVRGNFSASVPKAIFEFLKLGNKNQIYDLSDLSARLGSYVELAYGHTRALGDVVTVGARAKLLFGLLGGNLEVNRFDLMMTSEQYVATLEAELDMNSRLFDFMGDKEKKDPKKDKDKDKWRHLPSAGAAFDFGVAVKPVEGLTLSASILDVGGVLWYCGNSGRSDEQAYFKGLDLTYEELNKAGLLHALGDVGQEFLDAINFKEVSKKKLFMTLPFQANLGAKYTLPFHEKMTVGLTSSFSGHSPVFYWDARLGVAERFNDWIEVTANAGRDSFGMVYGFAGTLRLGNFRLHASLQDNLTKSLPASRLLPVKASGQYMSLGLSYDL